MPSPFPGMDPYLEGELWQEFHERLANQISVQLMPQLGSRYVALLAKRFVTALPPMGTWPALGVTEWPSPRVLYPDVAVTVREPPPGYGAQPAAPTVEVASPLPERIPQLSVEIRDLAGRRLVTLIEILSPANKEGPGVAEYHERRLSVLQTQTHLLELDLLRRGTRVALLGEVPPADYYVYLSRAERRPYTQVWPIGLREMLPTVPVPLLPPDPDVSLDLQAAVDACFALVGYERLLDYTQPPPPPPLADEDAAWADELLRRAGWR
ncbi:MAG: DUF4058 family protein [Anaerolineae bacterium]|nr:DUF4058 family protein [Anaerolineae bacterium]